MKKPKVNKDRFKGEAREVELKPFKHFVLSKDERREIQLRLNELRAQIQNAENVLDHLENENANLLTKINTPGILCFIIDYLEWKNKPVHISEIEDAIVESGIDSLHTKDIYWDVRCKNLFINNHLIMYKDIFYLNPKYYPKWKNKIKSDEVEAALVEVFDY